MIYNFIGKNNDINFSINNEKEFKLFLGFLDTIFSGIEKDFIDGLKKYSGVHVEKYTTKQMCKYLGCMFKNKDFFNIFNKILHKRNSKGLILTIQLIRFYNFISRTRGGFVICKR